MKNAEMNVYSGHVFYWDGVYDSNSHFSEGVVPQHNFRDLFRRFSNLTAYSDDDRPQTIGSFL